jgi:hypothetical protein
VDQIKIPVDFIVSRPVASCLGHGRYVMRDDEAKVAAHTSKGWRRSAGKILAEIGWFCERKHCFVGLMNSKISGGTNRLV